MSEAEALRPRPELPPERRALAVVGAAPAQGDQPARPGEERWIDADLAEAAGYTLIDFSDDWTPYIFAEQTGPDGEPLSNRYRRIFVGLANDELDEDGEPLPPGAKNYLELYGIFPSMSVLRARFVNDEEHPCHDQESADALDAVETVTYVPPNELKKDERKLAKFRKELEEARRKAHAATLEDLVAKQPNLAPKLKLLEKRAAEKPAMAAVEKRLTCEGLLNTPKGPKHQEGIYDDAMRLAVRRFQQKHMIYEANFLRRKTVEALSRTLLDNDYDAFVRALRERVVDAAQILEDGSASKTRNLVDEYLKLAVDQLGFPDAASVLAFFKRHGGKDDLKGLRLAVKLPPRPDYYGPEMDLSIVVDRGDVWYDLPFDAQGHYKPQTRKKYPSLTLYTKAGGKQVALARWRTTIGGWRADQAPNGYEYFRYKGSDVGPRVIRHVVSGPVWIAPASTPIRSLVKGKLVNSKWMSVVNYDELGPGYLSAYGLVAGYFVVPGQNGRADFDNGVRAHGSSDYLSIYSPAGYSHGCHRLPNHLAIRLYSFMLHHRHVKVAGDQPMGFTRQFLWKNTVYEMRIPSRGYLYEMDPPVPVNVLEGNIMGDVKKPIL
ncbi:MAG TPA: L,D-transpeptidase, partial [Polyangia bacterium]|nr:L,D-transpeptidase [Polyangia bacterium]